MGGVAGELAAHNEWLELLAIRNRHTKQILYQRLSPDERDAFQERAAVIQYSCGMERDEAEWEALSQLIHRRFWRKDRDAP